ncbi:MAG: MEDS domain-containing protein [Acidobacteriota bacterium]
MLRSETTGVSATGAHAVQFYEDDEFLATVVADFLATGLRLGRPCVVIATLEHRTAIEAALRHNHAVDVDDVLYLDARETLTQFMFDGRPDRARFAESVGRLVADIAVSAPEKVIHAFGEMVNVLCADRMVGAAIELEGLWNDLIARYAVHLLCAYQTSVLRNADGGATFDHLCGCHIDVLSTQRLAMQPDEAARLRHIARLEHRVRDFEPASVDERGFPALVETESAARVRFVSVASHELRNPVHVLRLQLQAALRALSIDEVPDLSGLRARIERADAQAVKVSQILDDMLMQLRHSEN